MYGVGNSYAHEYYRDYNSNDNYHDSATGLVLITMEMEPTVTLISHHSTNSGLHLGMLHLMHNTNSGGQILHPTSPIYKPASSVSKSVC